MSPKHAASAPVVTNPLALDLAALPKVSLHDHLDGGLRPATILDLAQSIGHQLPADTTETLAEWFQVAANAGSLESYLETFEHTTAVMQTADALQRVAREFVEDLIDDGVVYAEVRWAPEQHIYQGLSLEDAVEAVQAGLEQGCQQASDQGQSIQVQQLLCAMRQADQAQTIAELAVRYRDSGVAGFDIAGPEDGFPPHRFAETFTWLTEQFMPITVHAGEAAGIDSVADAIISGRALRLGHGVRVCDDIMMEDTETGDALVSLGRVAEGVLQRQMVLELCPSSNLQTGAVEPGTAEDPLANHPFGLLHELGFAVTVNPDNRLISGTTVTDELYLLTHSYGYTLEDLLEFQLNAARGAFISQAERDNLLEKINRHWCAVIEDHLDPHDPHRPTPFTALNDD
ncbi:adenosine deaminase [Auritidibacter ignavus]|uniref:adenosine deaminase n=1 Tax=Auritidibacter ignavus TaxID=678932 RepID=UPI00109BF85E|nr:adenosine deaminase [Auritidibacter ignavus]